MLADKPLKVAVVPEPLWVAPPGVAVKVHAPDGSPLKATLPVAKLQVGGVIVPTVGAAGAAGLVRTAFTPVTEVHPLAVICKLL